MRLETWRPEPHPGRGGMKSAEPLQSSSLMDWCSLFSSVHLFIPPQSGHAQTCFYCFHDRSCFVCWTQVNLVEGRWGANCLFLFLQRHHILLHYNLHEYQNQYPFPPITSSEPAKQYAKLESERKIRIHMTKESMFAENQILNWKDGWSVSEGVWLATMLFHHGFCSSVAPPARRSQIVYKRQWVILVLEGIVKKRPHKSRNRNRNKLSGRTQQTHTSAQDSPIFNPHFTVSPFFIPTHLHLWMSEAFAC